LSRPAPAGAPGTPALRPRVDHLVWPGSRCGDVVRALGARPVHSVDGASP